MVTSSPAKGTSFIQTVTSSPVKVISFTQTVTSSPAEGTSFTQTVTSSPAEGTSFTQMVTSSPAKGTSFTQMVASFTQMVTSSPAKGTSFIQTVTSSPAKGTSFTQTVTSSSGMGTSPNQTVTYNYIHSQTDHTQTKQPIQFMETPTQTPHFTYIPPIPTILNCINYLAIRWNNRYNVNEINTEINGEESRALSPFHIDKTSEKLGLSDLCLTSQNDTNIHSCKRNPNI